MHRNGDIRGNGHAPPEITPLGCFADTLPIAALQWLWPDRIALGALTLIAGQGGRGKSTLLADFIASITAEKKWPDGEHGPQGQVILIGSEDDWSRVVKPRLVAAGASLGDVCLFDEYKTDGETRGFNFFEGMPAFLRAIDRMRDLRAIIVDPITAYLGGRSDGNNAAELRQLLRPYVKVAQERQFAMIAINHLNRGASPDPVQRILGSGAYVHVARSNFVIVEDAEDEGHCFFFPFKMNLSKDTKTGYGFHIEQAIVDGANGESIETSRVRWDLYPIRDRTALDAFAAALETKRDRGAKAEEATDLIRQTLAERGGLIDSKELVRVLKDRGISYRTYERARAALKSAKEIRSEKLSLAGGEEKWVVRAVKRQEDDNSEMLF